MEEEQHLVLVNKQICKVLSSVGAKNLGDPLHASLRCDVHTDEGRSRPGSVIEAVHHQRAVMSESAR